MANEDIFADRTAPTEDERFGYYYGIGSRPILVARSSTDVYSDQYDGWAIGKRFSPVGHHAIAKPWNDSTSPLRRDIVQALDGIDWSAIDILRLGYQRTHGWTGQEFAHPVALLISVQEGSTTWAQGLPVVMRCHEILQLHGIPDVHCEIRESHFSHGASSPTDTPASEPTFVRDAIDSPHSLIKTRALWSEYLGLSIASSGRPTREGTKGLYLRLKDSGKIVALTCRHLIFEEPKPEFRHIDGDTQRCTVMQPGDETLNEHKEHISWKLERAPQAIKNLESDQKLPEDSRRKMLQQRRDDLPVLERTERDLRRLDDPANRIFGHVIYAPELSKGRTDTGGDRLRDWALIELHPEKFATSLDELRNQVFVGDDDDATHLLIRARVAEDIKNSPSGIMWSNVAWLEEDTIPEIEMRKVSEEAGSLGNDPAIAVAKYGSSTGLTAGFANGIKSLIRHTVDGIYVHSEEWCILGSKEHGNSDDRRGNFSWRGDSGACVWGGSGRVGGILTGGNGGRLGGFDISYATPMEWLLDDIKAHGYDVELITGWR